jgi:hypothetical protein
MLKTGKNEGNGNFSYDHTINSSGDFLLLVVCLLLT